MRWWVWPVRIVTFPLALVACALFAASVAIWAVFDFMVRAYFDRS